MLILSGFSIAGLVFLTKFSFNSSDNKEKRTVNLTNFQMSLCRLSVVLLWINIALCVINAFLVTR
jgi:hypothetical protein